MLRVLLALACLAAAAQAHAQFKVSEIMAKGGQVMTREQIRAELAGARVSGANEFGVEFELSLAADGTLEGMAYAPRGATGLAGTWRINAKNQVCAELVMLASRAATKRCNWYWKAGDEYYATNSRTDDEAAEKFVECLLAGGKDCDGGFSLAKRTVRK